MCARQVYDMLEAIAAKTKARIYKSVKNDKESTECKLEPPRGFYFQRLKEMAENLPTPALLPVENQTKTKDHVLQPRVFPHECP